MINSVTWSANCTEEIGSRLTIRKRASKEVKIIITAERIIRVLKKRFAKCFLRGMVLNGSETRTIRKKDAIERIEWRKREREISGEVLRTEEKRSLMRAIGERKISCLCHILRRDCLQRKVIQEMI